MLTFRPCTSLDITDEVQRALADPALPPNNQGDPAGHESPARGQEAGEGRLIAADLPAGTDRLYHYVIVRGDLPLGDLAAQIVHAAGESAALRAPEPGTHAVVLAASSSAALEELEAELADRGVRHVSCREPDAPWNGALLAIGIEPAPRASRRFLKRLPLLRGAP